MKAKFYTVINIEGEYAYLREDGCADSENDLFIALALLPLGVDVGTRLRSEMLQFYIVD